MIDLTTVLSGLVVGMLVGATGVGGGSLMTPLLVLLMGVPPATAVGTDLLYASVTKAGGAWAHGRRGNVDWKLAKLLCLGSLPAAVATLVLLNALSVDADRYNTIITKTLGVALVFTAAALLLKDRLHAAALRRRVDSPNDEVESRIPTIVTGVVLGVLVTASSVGAGALGVTALLFLYPGMVAVRIVGTDIAHAVPLTLVAGLGHASLGGVDWGLLGNLLCGSLPGVYIGSSLGRLMSERVLRFALASILLVVSARLLI